MKKRVIKGTLLSVAALTSLLSCQNNVEPVVARESVDKIDKNNIAFTSEDIVNDKFK